MYSANKRQRRHKVFMRFMLFVTPFFVVIGLLVWFILFRSVDTTTNFARSGAQVATVKPATKELTTDLFKISLPTTWESLGKKNPFSDEVFYEFQSTQKDYDNRWLRVYVDTFPKDYPLNRLMPISIVENRIVPGALSDECSSFTGAPLDARTGQTGGQNWTAKWQGIDFICDMTKASNKSGTASAEEGYGVKLRSGDGVPRKYFFVYIDQNIRPDYQIFTDALKSFKTL
jgi:hypothetical protein